MPSKRIKPKGEVVADLKQAEAAVAEIAEIDRSAKRILIDAQDVIDKMKSNAKKEMAPLTARRKELASAVQGFATVNKSELFKKKKSLAFAIGSIGFRQCTKLVSKTKVTMAQVLEKLKDYKYSKAIKTTETVNKEVMRGWSDEKLETVGMARKITDDFFIEIPEENLGDDQE